MAPKTHHILHPRSPPEDTLLNTLPPPPHLHSVSVISPNWRFPGRYSSYTSYGFLLSPQAYYLILFLFNRPNVTTKTVSKLVLWPRKGNSFISMKAKLLAYNHTSGKEGKFGEYISCNFEMILSDISGNK